MWDARANGYARGEGIAAVVLKTLSAAIADGDDIECLIIETGYFEAHGTGTPAGDPIEAEAIHTALFQNNTPESITSPLTTLSYRTSFSATNVDDLRAKLDEFVEHDGEKQIIAVSGPASPLRILGIFTGQGAQWAGMARKLIQLPGAARIVENLERSLSELIDPPKWSLKEEFLADPSSSRIMEPAVAQPACTAVQIILVDLLRAAGISFSAVVGHSSGEIGAAYAAGYLSANDAIRIGYYRGVHLGYDEAERICDLEEFRGRLCVAASNSASSVTLSGDIRAVEEVKAIFEKENKFARLLRVDNAYHSHHMVTCSEAITASLRVCNIKANRPSRPGCLWVSSVYQHDIAKVTDNLNDIYWHSNTISPVLFSQALEYALDVAEFDLAIELGAHPALKGPASQVIESALGHTIPYTGLLSRNKDDIEAVSEGLGFIWTTFGSSSVDFAGHDSFLNASEIPKTLKGLPTYPWEHDREFWHESRTSKMFRERRSNHELLGTRTPYQSEDQVSWTNYLIPRELPWMTGHRIQEQMIFPCAGYISSAFEAAQELAVDQPVKLIELTNFSIGQPLVFDTEESSVEVLVSMTNMKRHDYTLDARFNYYSVTRKGSGPMSLNANGDIQLVFGEANADGIQPMPESQFGMTKVDSETIYSSFASCGYEYTGVFKALHSVERKLGIATGSIYVPEATSGKELLIHPAALDAAMHSILVANCYPGDGRMTSVSLPTAISRISIDPSQALAPSSACNLKFLSSISQDHSTRTEGDVELYPEDGSNALLQLEGLQTRPMVPATAADDVHMFSELTWGPASPSLNVPPVRTQQNRYIRCDSGYSDTDIIKTSLEAKVESDTCGEQGVLDNVTAIVKQLCHRFPALNILEVGAGTGQITKPILTALDGAFASYTCTDPAVDRAEQIKQSLNIQENKFIPGVLDIHQDLAHQGCTQHSFDLIVASLIAQTDAESHKTVQNARKLLRPGGYILLLEAGVIGSKESGCPFHKLSGHTLDQSPSLCNDITDWRKLLAANGFDNAEMISDDTGRLSQTMNVVFGQAVDERTMFLRNPLASVVGNVRDCSVTFVGGATVASARCLKETTKFLQRRSGKITQMKDLETVANVGLPLGGTVVCLQDHDNFVFEAFDERKLKGLQELFGKSRNILWVTRDYRLGSPYAKMMVAFARCVLQELTHVQLQILDLASSDSLDARLISEHLLRLLVTEQWKELGQLDSLLWSLEPEVSYHAGQEFIPRVKLSKYRNAHYNSGRRQITENVDQSNLPVTLSVHDHGYTLRSKAGQVQNTPACKIDYAKISVRVSYSCLKAVKLGSFGFFHLLVGFDSVSGEQVIALSSSLSSEVDVPVELTRSCSLPREDVIGYLTALFYRFLSCATLEHLGCGDSLLVLEPDENLADAIWHTETARGVAVKFLTAGNKKENQAIWESMHPRPSRKGVHAILPHQSTRVLCWQQNHWTSTVCRRLPHGTTVEVSESYIALKATGMHSDAIGSISGIFDRARMSLLSTSFLDRIKGVCAVPLNEVHKLSTSASLVTVVDWMSSPTVPIILDPVDKAALFRDDVSYWLVGLTGGLGLSLCEWMISRGARHIAVSSRNPQIDPRRKAYWKSLNTVVNIYANDVTDREAVRSLYAKIQADMPPVAGVCQGAMVLEDTLLQNLNIERMDKVLKPKVDGALNLDEIFRHQKLDFFVMLSSIAAVLGNPGQAAYAAANGFLAGLATKRRVRGVAASTVNIGAVAGIGYVTRELTQAQQTGLQKAGAVFMSEQDFHQAFAEAVIASPPNQTSSYEFNTGLRVCYADEADRPKFVSNPVFSHLLLHRDVPVTARYGTTATATIKAQLLEASAAEEIYVIMKDALVAKLRKTLQMSPDADVLGQTADTLGVDSLIAVDVKSWFLKDMGIDMPVLTILGGATISEILKKAQELLGPAMTAARIYTVTEKPVTLDDDISGELDRYGETSFGGTESTEANLVSSPSAEASHRELKPDVAGLTLANILEQLNIDYLVLEKYGKIAPDLGASIGIFPNGFRILDQIGCYDAIKDLVEGADAFETLALRNERGKIFSEVKQASQCFVKRLGYAPIFVDRQMIIQVLYDNLRDKSKVITSKGVVEVEQSTGKVKVVTGDGDTFRGDLLVGADGIHSTVRREMWKLADADSPGYFPASERTEVPTEYCCIFGISRPTDKFRKYSSQTIQGRNYSYLVATGPNHRIYWFLFKKLDKAVHGLYEKVPRYTEEQRDALAAEHAADPISDGLTFGELYEMRTTATLQALPEVVFKKWHYKRIITIGDAAHKFNPIGGQGGSSAIEDAAVLADHLQELLNKDNKDDGTTDADIIQAFRDTQRIRFDRADRFLKDSHNQQSVQAMDSLFSKIIAKIVMPLSKPEAAIEMICGGSRGAARIKALPMPTRPHSELWDDEKKPSPFNFARLDFLASVASAVELYLALKKK
ncbi:hypothetical protein N0V94_007953 [Neodidymelliopsis sp. IMI 364377]|nr:hypothetical protein N0V94_007953 [Neodidymelliopsis sp. IMI 364377]